MASRYYQGLSFGRGHTDRAPIQRDLVYLPSLECTSMSTTKPSGKTGRKPSPPASFRTRRRGSGWMGKATRRRNQVPEFRDLTTRPQPPAHPHKRSLSRISTNSRWMESAPSRRPRSTASAARCRKKPPPLSADARSAGTSMSTTKPSGNTGRKPSTSAHSPHARPHRPRRQKLQQHPRTQVAETGHLKAMPQPRAHTRKGSRSQKPTLKAYRRTEQMHVRY